MIALVACCGKKLLRAAPAQDLYVSPLFVKSRAWAEKNASRWFILSALHGLVEPTEVLEPYNHTLPANDAAWGYKVFGQLSALHLEREDFAILAGERYVRPLRDLLKLFEVLKGQQIGERLQFLT